MAAQCPGTGPNRAAGGRGPAAAPPVCRSARGGPFGRPSRVVLCDGLAEPPRGAGRRAAQRLLTAVTIRSDP
eukprot:677543-Hanusia_phi.AAC.1